MAAASNGDAAEEAEERPRVFLKLCPTATDEQGDVEQGVLEVVNPTSVSIYSADEDEPTTSELDGVLEESASSTILYEIVTADLAERFVGGRDCTLMAYGAAQTGKTYNLFGNRGDGAATTDTIAPTGNTEQKNQCPDAQSPATETKEGSSSSASADVSYSSGDSHSGSSENPIETSPQTAPVADDANEFGLDDLISGALEGIPAAEHNSNSEHDDAADKQQNSQGSEGIVIPLCRKIFEVLEMEAPEILSLTIKLSVVEIYLDRITDLLLPQLADSHVYLKEDPRGGATLIQGCAALSCVQPSDVQDAIRRALWQRTRSQAEPFRDSHRSSVVVQIRLEQERTRQMNRSSVLHMVDLCASELSSTNVSSLSSSGAAKDLDQKIVAALLDLQREVQDPTPFSGAADRPALSRLLLPFCRAETVSRVLLTASKQNVAACQRTMDFGLACRRLPAVRLPPPRNVASDSTLSDEGIAREKRLTELVFALAHECQRVAKVAKTPKHGPVWTAISEIQRLPHQNRPLNFSVETKREHEINAEKFAIRAELREAERKASTHRHLMKTLESEIQVLKAQNEQLKYELQQRSSQFDQNKHRMLTLEQRVKEVEHNLRTSQFRESEAVVFLRQFRKFYYRLMRQIHGEDSSSGGSIVKQIAGAADIMQLIDLDKCMVESGLMEEEEVEKDIPISKTYLPSRQALVRSVIAADAAAAAAGSDDLATNGDTQLNGDEKDAVELSDKIKTTSIVKRHETGEATEARQRIYKTPAGRYLAMRENKLEADLLAMSEKYAKIQSELEEERATRIDLESTSTAVNKAKHAKELRTLKEQLNKKANDLKAVIFKMNEIHTVSKTLQEKVADREQHVDYLEEEISTMQTKESALLATKDEAEQSLKKRITDLEQQIKSDAVALWQLGEPGTVPPSITSRISLSFSAQDYDADEEKGSVAERRMSVGEEDDWLGRLCHRVDSERRASGEGGAAFPNEQFEALKKELKMVKDQLQEALSRPGSTVRKFTPKSFVAAHSTPTAASVETETSGFEEDEPSASVEESESANHSVSGLLFMDDDVAPNSSHGAGAGNTTRPRRPSVYGGLVDAYNMQSDTSMPDQTPGPEKVQEERTDYKEQAAAQDEQVGQTKQDGHRRTSSLQGQIARWQPPKPKVADDDDSVTPEWMKKFKKIAARNHAESVIETSGGAEAREMTRTCFGETLKHTHNPDTQTWKDEEDKNSGENKDSPSRPSSPVVTPPSPVRSPVRSPFRISGQSPTSSGRSPSSPGRSPSYSPARQTFSLPPRTNSEASGLIRVNSASAETESFDPNRLKHMFAAKAANAKPLVPSGSHFNPSYTSGAKKWAPKKNKDDNSDSDDSFAKGFLSAASSQVVDQPTVGLDSTAGSGSDKEEEESPPSAATETAPAPVPVLNNNSFLDQSEREGDAEDDAEDDRPVKKAPAQLPTLVPAVRKKKKSFLDDSDSEADSDADEPVKRTPAAAPAPSSPTRTKSFLEDSDSEGDSDVDEPIKKKAPAPETAPATAPTPLPNAGPTPPARTKSFLQDSDSGGDSDDDKPIKMTPALASPARASSFLEVSDSEGHSENEKPVQEAPALAAPSARKPPARTNSFLEDSDSEGDSDENKPVKQAPACPPPRKKSFLDESDSEVDSGKKTNTLMSSSSHSAASKKSVASATHSLGRKKSFLDDSESDMASVDEQCVKEVPAAAPAKMSFLHDSDSEGESESERGFEPPPTTSKAHGDEDSDSESRSDKSSVEDVGSEEEGEEEETERAGSGHKRLDDSGNIGNFASRSGDSPVALRGSSSMVDNNHDSDGNSGANEYIGKAADATAIRNVPDFGADIQSAIPTAEPSKKDKEKFVIKGGKLVKDSNPSQKGGDKSKNKKTKFAIKGGKLVQTEDSNTTHHKPTKTAGAEPKHEKALTAMVPAARGTKKGGKSTNFVIKGGKLVKNEEKVKQPAFSIMGGKLVKGSDVKKGRKKPKKKDAF